MSIRSGRWDEAETKATQYGQAVDARMRRRWARAIESGRAVEVAQLASDIEADIRAGRWDEAEAKAAQYELAEGADEETADWQGKIRDARAAAQIAPNLPSCSTASECQTLGGDFYSGRGVTLHYPTAAALFNRACSQGSAMGCFNAASMYYAGRGVAEDRSRAVELYRQACDGGAGSGCNSLGTMYANGIGVAVNLSRAVELYRQACDRGAAQGCENLRLHNAEPRVEVDHGEAFDARATLDARSPLYTAPEARREDRITSVIAAAQGVIVLRRSMGAGRYWYLVRLENGFVAWVDGLFVSLE